MLLQAQALLQGKLDGDVKATLLEVSILSRSIVAGMYHLSDGSPALDRLDVVRQRKADLGLGGGSKTVKDVGPEATALFYQGFVSLQLLSTEPEHRCTVPSAADFEEARRLMMESMAPWEACGRGEYVQREGVGQGARARERLWGPYLGVVAAVGQQTHLSGLVLCLCCVGLRGASRLGCQSTTS